MVTITFKPKPRGSFTIRPFTRFARLDLSPTDATVDEGEFVDTERFAGLDFSAASDAPIADDPSERFAGLDLN